jgi:peroxiredoxin (alkyl hydroperoxide reductase subunit C)|tara:strand:+ start:24486 stop:25034 length:549 start_codon:yes stop_codon:yes gene_type:complete
MLTVGDKFPQFNLQAVDAGLPKNPSEAFFKVSDDSYEGKWKVVFFWPKDFTFICPTEIAEFGRLNGEFADRDTQVLGVSTDSEFVHLAWKRDHEDLRDLPFPMVADIKGDLCNQLGILDAEEGVALRATFIVDPDGVIQHVAVNGLNVGRNPGETLRILDALQTDELCPCNWSSGEEVIKVA